MCFGILSPTSPSAISLLFWSRLSFRRNFDFHPASSTAQNSCIVDPALFWSRDCVFPVPPIDPPSLQLRVRDAFCSGYALSSRSQTTSHRFSSLIRDACKTGKGHDLVCSSLLRLLHLKTPTRTISEYSFPLLCSSASSVFFLPLQTPYLPYFPNKETHSPPGSSFFSLCPVFSTCSLSLRIPTSFLSG